MKIFQIKMKMRRKRLRKLVLIMKLLSKPIVQKLTQLKLSALGIDILKPQVTDPKRRRKVNGRRIRFQNQKKRITKTMRMGLRTSKRKNKKINKTLLLEVKNNNKCINKPSKDKN